MSLLYTYVPKWTKIISCMLHEICNTTDIIFCHFGPLFAILPLENPENQNFEKLKKMPGSIIISYMCNINDNHMIYGS